MVVHSIIIVISAALFAYWFRYSCLLILSAQTSEDFAPGVAESAGLGFLDVVHSLREGQGIAFEQVRETLDRDYATVCRLLDGNPEVEAHLCAVERTMLRADYALMRAWSALCRTAFPEQSRRALLEMGAVLTCFANAAGSAESSC